MESAQFVGVSGGVVVELFGEHEPGSGEASELCRLETGQLQAVYGSDARVVVVDDDVLLDVGDAVVVDDEGVATLAE